MALAAGGGLAGASSGATVPGTEPAGTTGGSAAPAGEPVTFETGLEFNSILLPKFTGIAVFDQANQGAQEAAAELGAQPAEFLGPTADNSVAGQIDIVTNAATQGVDAVMMSNNAGDQIVPAVQAARRHRCHRRDVGLADPDAPKVRACSSPRSTSTRPER